MKRFEFEKKKAEGFKAIEAGGYVCKVLNAEVIGYDWGEVLKIDFDITEGEFKDYFFNQYQNNTNEDKHWQGSIRITVPSEGAQYYESQKKKFGNMIACFEESNTGYAWDWDETKLKGKSIGIIFGNEEYSFNGYEGWKARPKLISSVEDIRNGNFRVPKDKPLKNKPDIMDCSVLPVEDILPWEN
jgi:hypothetical protein